LIEITSIDDSLSLMNEKIKTYLKQFLVDNGDYRDHQGYLVSSKKYTLSLKEMDELIELLVNECASIARVHNLEEAERSYMIHKAIKNKFKAID